MRCSWMKHKLLEIMSKEEIGDFLSLIFGVEEGLHKSVCDYLTSDIRLPDTKHVLPKELWEYLQRKIISKHETDSICMLLCLLKNKIEDDNMKLCQTQLQESESCTSNFSEDTENVETSYIKEIEFVFINCLEECLMQIQRSKDSIRLFEQNLEKPHNENITNLESNSIFTSQKNDRSDLENSIKELYSELDTIKHKFFVVLSFCNIEILHSELEALFTNIIILVHEDKIIDLHKLYLALLCGTMDMLLKFCSKESSFLKQPDLALCILQEESLYSKSTCRSLFLHSINSKKHMATIFYELMINVFSKNFPIDLPLNMAWCLPFYILICIHQWSLSQNKLTLLPVLESVFSKYGNASDPLIQSLCTQKIKHMMLTQWCSKYKPSVNIHKLLMLLQSHSSLYAIQASLPLFYLPYEGFLELLLKDNQIQDSTGCINEACAATYQGYSVLLLAFHIIMAGVEMDKVISAWRERKVQSRGFLNHCGNGFCGNFEIEEDDLNTCKVYYKTHIVKKWLNIRRILNEIHPLEYRLEILENLFSLLFIKHTNLSDEGKEDSWFDESDQTSPVSLKPDKDEIISNSSLISSSSLSHVVTSFKMTKPAFKVSTLKSEKVFSFNDLNHYSEEDLALNIVSDDDDIGLTKTDSEVQLGKPFQIISAELISQGLKESCSCPSLKLLTSTNSELSSSSNVGDFSWCGYIINTLVSWDLLLLLKDSVEKLETEVLFWESGEAGHSCILSSVTNSQFSERLNSLKHRVNDSVWRIKVVLPQERELGSDEQVADFMKGTLYSSMSSVVHYEVENQDQERKLLKGKNLKKRRSKTTIKFESPKVYKEKESITNFLLSSAQDLISIALVNENLTAGQEVLLKHNLGNSKEKQELVLMQCLKENIPKIEEISKLKSKEVARKVCIESSRDSAAKKIENEIHSSSHNVAISALIDQALNLPLLENLNENDFEAKASETPWIEICPKLVLLDIALTSYISEENASKLFTVAFNQEIHISSKSVTKSSSVPLIHEYFEKLPQLTCMTQVMESIKLKPKKSILKEGNLNILKVLLPKTSNPASLLLSKCPLNKEDFETFQTTWVKLLSCLSCFENECLKLDSESLRNRATHSEGDFHSVFKNILALVNDNKLCRSIFSSPKCLEGYGEYLLNFVNYIEMLKSVVCKYSPSPLVSHKSSFEVLEQRPIRILGNLIFNKRIDPYQLEMEFQHVELDMLSVIVRYASSPSEVLHYTKERSVSDNSVPSLESLGCLYIDNFYVMNANRLTCFQPVHGDLVVSDLLSSLLDLLRDFDFENPGDQLSLGNTVKYLYLKNSQIKTLLLECSELSSTDLTKLTGEYEPLVFFVNLANLMFIHAILLNFLIYDQVQNDDGIFSKSKMEQIIAFKRVGYLVGQLGFVSLYDIIYKILKQPLIYDRHNVSKSTVLSLIETQSNSNEFSQVLSLNMLPHPLLIFIVCQGLSPSPKIGIFYPDTFKEELSIAVLDYVMHVILPNLHNNFKSLEMNPVLFTFLSTHPLGWNEAIKSLRKIIGETEEALVPMYLDWLKKINIKKPNLKVRPNFTFEKVIIEYISTCDTTSEYEKDITSEKSGHPPRDPLSLPTLCFSYINDNCPIMNTLLQAFHLTVKDDAALRNQIEIIGKNEPDVTFLNNLFYSCKIYHSSIPCIKNTFEKSKVIASLHFEQYYPSIISTVEDILASIPQEDFLKRNVSASKNILKIVDILSELPSIVCDNHFVLSYIWDSVMMYLSSVDASSVLPSPWSFVFRIKNSSLRFRAMQDNYTKWPIEIILRCLRYMDSEKHTTPSQREFVQHKINQMEIYSEIMKLPKEHLCLETCQDVLQASLATPEDLMTHLIHQRQFTLALRWVKSHGLTERFYLQTIETSLLQCLDVMDPDLKSAESILNNVSPNKLESIINDLLVNINVHSTKKFIMSFFLKNHACEVTVVNLWSMRQELMGLILIEDVAPKTFNRSQLFSLITRPHLIIEQWIMNLKFDAVEKAITFISHLLDSTKCANAEPNGGSESASKSVDCLCWNHYHTLVEKYAFRALEISGIQVSLKHSLKAETQTSQFVIPLQVPLKSEWQKNSSVTTCPVCKTAIFSLFCRRHHCRRCGRVVCASCSVKRHRVRGYGDVPVRVCQNCYTNLNNKYPMQDHSISVGRSSASDINESQPSEGVSSNSEIGWYFSIEPYHNQCVREEFSFDYAPSLSLCQAILALHKDDNRAALCILKLTLKMFRTAIDAFSADFSEVDSNFVLQMIQTLVSSAKVRFGKLWNHNGVSLCEYYMQWVGLLQILLKSRFVLLLPSGTLSNMLEIGDLQRMQLSGVFVEPFRIQQKLEQERRFLRILRDNLVKKEMWDLALDISTKAGFETSGVWGALAMASLKAGDFAMAREYFSKVLTKPRDKNTPTKSAVLGEIICYLESSPFNISQGSLDKKMSLSENLPGTSLNPLIITQTLMNLSGFAREISRSDVCNLDRILPLRGATHSLSSLHQRECEYYLRLYGSHRAFLQFMMRHNRTRDAVRYAKEVDIDEKIFTDEILLPSFRKGRFNRVWMDIVEVDSKQTWSSTIVYHSCKYLERSHHLHCLLELQKVLSDRLRAAMTLLRLYTRDADSYSELVHRTHYLTEATSHLQAYLDVIPLTETSFRRRTRSSKTPKRHTQICLHSASWNVNRQINLSSFQDDVTKYLADFETSGTNFKPLIEVVRNIVLRGKRTHTTASRTNDSISGFQIPTVFPKEDRLVVSVVVMCIDEKIAKNLSLVYRLVETNSIDPKKLLSVTLETLITVDKTKDITSILESILEWGLIPTSQIKNAVWPAIISAGGNISDKVVRDIAKFMISARDKMEVFMEAGLLKLAYSQVNEKGSEEDVEKLREVATQRGDRTVAFYCAKWLQNYSRKRAKIQR